MLGLVLSIRLRCMQWSWRISLPRARESCAGRCAERIAHHQRRSPTRWGAQPGLRGPCRDLKTPTIARNEWTQAETAHARSRWWKGAKPGFDHPLEPPKPSHYPGSTSVRPYTFPSRPTLPQRRLIPHNHYPISPRLIHITSYASRLPARVNRSPSFSCFPKLYTPRKPRPKTTRQLLSPPSSTRFPNSFVASNHPPAHPSTHLSITLADSSYPHLSSSLRIHRF